MDGLTAVLWEIVFAVVATSFGFAVGFVIGLAHNVWRK